MDYTLILVGYNRDADNKAFLYSGSRSWLQNWPGKLFVKGISPNYGYQHAIKQFIPNITFCQKDIPMAETDEVVILPINAIIIGDLTNHPSKMKTKDVNWSNLYIAGRINIQYLQEKDLHLKSDQSVFISPTGEYTLNSTYYQYYEYLDFIKYPIINLLPLQKRIIYVTTEILLPNVISSLIHACCDKWTIIVDFDVPEDYYPSVFQFKKSGDWDVCITDELDVNHFHSGKIVIIEGYHEPIKGWIHKHEDGYTRYVHPLAKDRVVVTMPFYNEVDMLRLHIAELYDVVDLFIIGEADEAFSNTQKREFCFPKDIPDPQNKILYTPHSYPDMPESNRAWHRDKFFRQYSVYHPAIGDRDLVIVCDVDEIVNPKFIEEYKRYFNPDITRLALNFHYYSLKWIKREKWIHTYIAPANVIRYHDADYIRINRFGNVVSNAGWHLSYFQPPELIAHKIKSFAHTEFDDPKYTSLEHIKKCLETGEDLFGRPGENLIHNTIPPPNNYNLIPKIYHP